MPSSSLPLHDARRLTCLIACIVLGVACDDGPRVPFKLAREADAGAVDGTGAKDPQRPAPEAVAYSDAVDQPRIDGVVLPLSAVRTTLVQDFDGDDDRDVLALVHDAEKRLRLLFSARDAQGFRPAQEIAGLTLPSDVSCTLKQAGLGPLSSDKALLTLDFVCGEERTPLPSAYAVLSTDGPPRVLLSLGQRPLNPGESPIALSVTSLDENGDGHHDIVLGLADQPSIKLTFRDRASGLSRDTSEPETSFAAEAKLADAELAKSPDEADARAVRALAGFDVLCREATAPRVSLDGELGIPCGKTPSRPKLLIISTLARARKRELVGALDAYRSAVGAGAATQGKQYDRIKTAFAKLATKNAKVLRTGPDVSVQPLPHLHLPAVRFVDEDTLVLGLGIGARSLRLGSGEEASLPSAPDPWLRDPSGQLAVLSAEQGCAGASLRIVRVPQGDAGYAAREPVGSVLVIPSGADPETCKGATRPLAAGELSVLGWAPQGLVVARASAVWVAPMSAEGQALGAPFMLAPDAPRPAPLSGGVAARDGSRFVQLSPVGIVSYGADARNVELIAPAGFAEVAGGATDVALSPSGQKLAVLAKGTLYVITR